MTQPYRPIAVPRAVLWCAAAMIGLTLATALAGRLGYIEATRDEAAPAVESRQLRFLDRADVGIVVRDAASDTVAKELTPSEGGFLRVVLRSLARERELRGLDSGPAFVVSRLADGRVAIEDPATGRRIDLGAYGPMGRSAFADLVPAQRPSS